MSTGQSRRALNEWAVLGLLAEAPAHPFAIARQLGPDGRLGRVITVRRPLVYRAVERLRRDGLVERHRTEPSGSGPERTVYRVTAAGRRGLDAWLREPVAHIRDLRLAFLLKLALLRMSGEPVGPLVAAQRAALAGTLSALERLSGDPDDTDLWRQHSAAAVASFLDDLSRRG